MNHFPFYKSSSKNIINYFFPLFKNIHTPDYYIIFQPFIQNNKNNIDILLEPIDPIMDEIRYRRIFLEFK